MASNKIRHACGPFGAAFFLSLSLVAQATPAAATLDFEKTFSAKGEPKQLHYRASYEDARGKHELEVWREGSTRLRRRTDTAMDLYVTQLKDGDLQMTLLDHGRKVRTEVSRGALYQLGQFSDWFPLAHSFGKPPRPYTLTALPSAPTQTPPLAACKWYQLDSEPQHAAICWSEKLRLPTLITDTKGTVRWQLLAADQEPPAPAVFTISSPGYVHVDADRDIKAD